VTVIYHQAIKQLSKQAIKKQQGNEHPALYYHFIHYKVTNRRTTKSSLQKNTHKHNNASNTQILPPHLHRLRRYVPSQKTLVTPPTNANPLVFAFSYTFIVASKEGAAMDMARTRWQHQHASARNVLSGGVTGVEGR
jgi:hypothetical protein